MTSNKSNTVRGYFFTLGMTSIAILAGAVLVTGCSTFTVDTPRGMVSIKRYETNRYYKAFAPDGSVATVTAFKHRDKGSLGFWTAVVKREMARRKGYKLLEAGKIKTGRGLTGQQLTYAVTNSRSKYRYLMTLFVSDSYLYAIEAASRSKNYDKHKEAFDSLVASFRPR